LDLSQLEPLVACPHSVDRVQPLSAVAGQRVDQAFIGTCTNGRLEDLAAAAEVLRGRQVNTATRLLVIPASSQVYRQALHAGYIDIFLEAGASIGVPGCGPCMGNHLGIPAAGETVISTANRNFRGRMGQPEAGIYLASPAVVAASAVLGRIAHPAKVKGQRLYADAVPALQQIASNPASAPAASASQPQVPLPAGAALDARAWKYGDNVNTDQIFPGKYTYTLTAPAEIAAHALEDLDPAFAGGVRAGDVIFAGRNFGCGSSREQAVTCLKANGVAAVVAISFGRIFYRNAINQGLPAIVCPAAVDAAEAGSGVKLDLQRGLIYLPSAAYPFDPFPAHIQAILEAGGLVAAKKGRS
jgi:3-isopropylmalate dehydratase small subunit